MANIVQLPPGVVNKIAAGEVIERPASVVKELLENSIDAGATRIDITIEKGGLEAIRVADNGSGIEPDQLPLAIACHATSKIRTAEDLFHVGTLGFRGEALASIAEVSRFSLKSRTAEQPGGFQIEVLGGEPGDPEPVGCPVGTTIEVRDLFFNIPVRRKFLRTTQTEMGHVSEAFTRVALAYPEVHFVLRHRHRTLHDLAPTTDLRERIARFFGGDLADGLIEIESEDEGIRIAGYVAAPDHSRANNRMQYLLLNGRAIRDRSLQHALGEAYRGLLLSGRYPICFLRLELPAELVDVNVHPTKHEVRFQDSGGVYSQLLRTLRMKFLTTDLTSRGRLSGAELAGTAASSSDEGSPSALVAWAKGELEARKAAAGWNQQEIQPTGSEASSSAAIPPYRPPGSSPYPTRPVEPHTPGSRLPPLTLNRIDPPAGERPAARVDAPAWEPSPAAATTRSAVTGQSTPPLGAPDDTEPETGEPEPGDPNLPEAAAGPSAFGLADHDAGPPPRALQVHNRYLVAETAEGLEVIDQHALHERILYEQLRDRVLAGAVETQRLLVPEPVDLSATEAAAVGEHRELLRQLGLAVDPFGGDTVLIVGYPAMLSATSPAEILREIVDQLLDDAKPPHRRDLLDDMLHMIACKAAVKFGDRLTDDEVTALLRQRHLARDHHHCPHGRPTALVLTRQDLDRQFKRV